MGERESLSECRDPYGGVPCDNCGIAGPCLYDDEGVLPIPTETLMLPSLRVFREYKGFQVFVGPWAARFSWSRSGWFASTAEVWLTFPRFRDGGIHGLCAGRHRRGMCPRT